LARGRGRRLPRVWGAVAVGGCRETGPGTKTGDCRESR